MLHHDEITGTGNEMNVEKRDFDKEAASWDEDPHRVKLATDIATAISQQITLKPDMDVLDFGCGTGLLTLRMAPLVRSITGVDSSRGMLNVLREKATKQCQTNIRVLQLDPDRGDTVTGQYDLIVSTMTFHHIENVEVLLGQLHGAIRFPGYLCVADLDPDQGQFHKDNAGVFHFGFERTTLRQSFMQTGFAGIKDVTAAEVVKPMHNGEIRRFTVFLMVGQKDALRVYDKGQRMIERSEPRKSRQPLRSPLTLTSPFHALVSSGPDPKPARAPEPRRDQRQNRSLPPSPSQTP